MSVARSDDLPFFYTVPPTQRWSAGMACTSSAEGPGVAPQYSNREAIVAERLVPLPCQTPGAGIMEANDRQLTTVSQSNRHSTDTRQTESHEALPSSAKDEVRCDCTFADDGNAS